MEGHRNCCDSSSALFFRHISGIVWIKSLSPLISSTNQGTHSVLLRLYPLHLEAFGVLDPCLHHVSVLRNILDCGLQKCDVSSLLNSRSPVLLGVVHTPHHAVLSGRYLNLVFGLGCPLRQINPGLLMTESSTPCCRIPAPRTVLLVSFKSSRCEFANHVYPSDLPTGNTINSAQPMSPNSSNSGNIYEMANNEFLNHLDVHAGDSSTISNHSEDITMA